VHLVVRADGLERSMARYLRDRIERDPKVEVLLGHEVRELGGDGHLELVTVEDARSGERRVLEAGILRSAFAWTFFLIDGERFRPGASSSMHSMAKYFRRLRATL
jgi:hypothetical protein